MNNDAVNKFIFLMKLNDKHIHSFQIIYCKFGNFEGLFYILVIKVIDIYMYTFPLLFSCSHIHT